VAIDGWELLLCWGFPRVTLFRSGSVPNSDDVAKGSSCRQPDVIVGTNDWNALEGFLHGTWDDPEPVEGILQGLSYKYNKPVQYWRESAHKSRAAVDARILSAPTLCRHQYFVDVSILSTPIILSTPVFCCHK
jgi:hypothetical protein